MNLNYLKIFVTAVTSLVASMLGVLYIPVLLMVACNVIDYTQASGRLITVTMAVSALTAVCVESLKR